MKLAGQLPFLDESVRVLLILKSAQRTTMPDSNRTTVKLDASMALPPNASLHSTEFAANAVSAKPVKTKVLIKELFGFVFNYDSGENITGSSGGAT